MIKNECDIIFTFNEMLFTQSLDMKKLFFFLWESNSLYKFIKKCSFTGKKIFYMNKFSWAYFSAKRWCYFAIFAFGPYFEV